VNDDNLERARKYLERKNYAMCLYSSTLAKSQYDVFFSLIGLSKDKLKKVLDDKFNVIKQKISSQEDFPLLAYSYYEYANSLKEKDISSAMLYAEYALGLSDLDIYMPKKSLLRINMYELRILILGISTGIFISLVLCHNQLT